MQHVGKKHGDDKLIEAGKSLESRATRARKNQKAKP
jgi:hypothetical protein